MPNVIDLSPRPWPVRLARWAWSALRDFYFPRRNG
jgi:hypothetical protein